MGKEVITSAITPVCIRRNTSTMPDERGLKTLSLSARLKLDFIIALKRSERVSIWLRCDLIGLSLEIAQREGQKLLEFYL